MDKYRKLNMIGKDLAEIRGHKMGKFRHFKRSVKNMAPLTYVVSMTLCKVCGMLLITTTSPEHNETEIAGEAIALDCAPQNNFVTV